MMSQTLSLSDDIYARLQIAAQRQGASVEEWIAERLPPTEDAALQRRREAAERIFEFQRKMEAKYGVQPDSVALIREDRER